MVKINNPLGDVKIGKQGEVVYQRKYGEQIRRMLAPKRAIPSKAQLDHRDLYRAALTWRSQLARANRRYLEGYCIANGIVDSYHIPLPWSRFALRIYLQSIKFLPDLKVTTGPTIPGGKQDSNNYPPWDDNWGGKTTWYTSTFTPLETYTIAKVVALCNKLNPPGIITIGIRATDGAGKPTGADLTAATTNGNTLPQFPASTWRQVTLPPYELQQGVKYAIVLRAPGADSTTTFGWKAGGSGSYYPRGQMGYS
ncbi:unnamed protein product, partial [marine sediment metagenome]